MNRKHLQFQEAKDVVFKKKKSKNTVQSDAGASEERFHKVALWIDR